MINDRRNYTRLSIVDVPILLYIDGVNFEVTGYVHDISELGIGITIDSDIDISQLSIELNDEVKIVFCDEVYYSNSSEKFVIMTNCIVRHIETKNNHLFLGGQVIDEDFHNYYLKKEMVNFRNSL